MKARPQPRTRRPRPRSKPEAAARRRPPIHLVQGNRKLGPRLIWSFSIPAVSTCVGSSAACRAACYALLGHYRHASVRDKYVNNLALTLADDFVATVVDEVRRGGVRVLRIHGSGDFYAAEYVRDWAEIARRCPETTFYTYTRSWRVEEVRGALAEFALLPNVRLWYSCDAETGVGPRDERVRLAFMLDAADDPAAVPPGIDLVFRVKETRPAKRMNGIQVCPYEDMVRRKIGRLTCDRCSICWTAPRNKAASPPVQIADSR